MSFITYSKCRRDGELYGTASEAISKTTGPSRKTCEEGDRLDNEK